MNYFEQKDKRIPYLLDVIQSESDEKSLEIATHILLAFDTISEIVLEVANDKVGDDEILRVESYLVDLVWSRNVIFKNRDTINIAFDYDFTIEQHEDSNEFGEWGYVMNIINETSNLIDKYREVVRRY